MNTGEFVLPPAALQLYTLSGRRVAVRHTIENYATKGVGFGGIGGSLSGGYGGGGLGSSVSGGYGGSFDGVGGISGGYGGGIGGVGSGLGGLGGGYGNWGSGEISEPRPYSTSFQAPDGQGGLSFRTEQGDGSGNVKGNYGYKDAQGLYRMVEYSAGRDGYTATINTNEPGVDGKENPADVIMNVGKTPAGIQERYTRPAGSSGRGGWGSGTGSGGYGGISSGTYGGLGGLGSYGGGMGSAGLGGIGGIGSGGYGGIGGIGSGGFSGISRGGMGIRSGKSGY
ncbi:hypothetical protein AVEN_37490-1 [Araneus ventricosus]|uniref:Cuticle protein 10.9 n=1 Tax=Araneus ventricosus TaxID=182803 RepID=A0A4Y2J6F4_ARAVE|nr:hypothetical protein AVEN_37490-1 [Araneus ventricosus]